MTVSSPPSSGPPGSGQVVYTSPYNTLVQRRVYSVITRTDTPFPDLKTMHRENALLVAAFQPLAGTPLILDGRKARPRNDHAFESESKRMRAIVTATFSPIAILVATVAGRMQVARLIEEDGLTGIRVFDDEGEAIAFLIKAAIQTSG